MSINSTDAISEALFDAEEALVDEPTRHTGLTDRSHWAVRDRSPAAVDHIELSELESELEFLSGTILLLRGEAESSLHARLERAFASQDGERALDLYEQLKPDMETSSVVEPRRVDAELIYDGTRLVEGLSSNAGGTFAAGFATFNGGNLDETKFEVREFTHPEVDSNYEYRVVIIPPKQNRAEEQAEEAAPEDTTDPVFHVSPNPTAACVYIAAGALAAAAVLGGSQADDPAVGSVDTTPSAEVGSSVDELIDARARL
jgi:hypothetical protein